MLAQGCDKRFVHAFIIANHGPEKLPSAIAFTPPWIKEEDGTLTAAADFSDMFLIRTPEESDLTSWDTTECLQLSPLGKRLWDVVVRILCRVGAAIVPVQQWPFQRGQKTKIGASVKEGSYARLGKHLIEAVRKDCQDLLDTLKKELDDANTALGDLGAAKRGKRYNDASRESEQAEEDLLKMTGFFNTVEADDLLEVALLILEPCMVQGSFDTQGSHAGTAICQLTQFFLQFEQTAGWDYQKSRFEQPTTRKITGGAKTEHAAAIFMGMSYESKMSLTSLTKEEIQKKQKSQSKQETVTPLDTAMIEKYKEEIKGIQHEEVIPTRYTVPDFVWNIGRQHLVTGETKLDSSKERISGLSSAMLAAAARGLRHSLKSMGEAAENASQAASCWLYIDDQNIAVSFMEIWPEEKEIKTYQWQSSPYNLNVASSKSNVCPKSMFAEL